MNPSFVVLTNASPAGEPTLAYAAALAAAVGATLHLVHVVPMPPVATLQYGQLLVDLDYVPAVRAALTKAATRLPVPTTVEVLEGDWLSACQQVLARHQPALLVAGLTATNGPLDELLSNRALPLPHQTGYPLLLVPERLPAAAQRPPRHLLLAVEDQPFRLTPPVRALAPLLDALACTVTPLTVLPLYHPLAAGEAGLLAAQACGLAAALPGAKLHRVVGVRPATGIWEAADELAADLVVLLDQGHGWVHKLFSGSVIADVLRYSQVPVLLLPVATD
ncbi:universal stress protein [Hymenobacter sp. H14-R3]|uniref:universal stress protein n=1 Tax=Hymenobacter sp. H14-R3 TaxID=3046308 RepID=UPI0024B9D350|nr:universal stress protein [Hymenobacter sp. H14-R3]MDJ0367789.1 universal stress protein [Hymenobacter sp. H14-R3]